MLFRGPRGIVAGTSGNGECKILFLGDLGSEKKAETSGNGVLGVPPGIPNSYCFGFTKFSRYLFFLQLEDVPKT